MLVVDDHRVFGESVGSVIDAADDLRCIAIVRSGEEAIAVAAAERPDVALIDVCLADEDGIDVASAVLAEAPGTRIVVITGNGDGVTLARAAAVGASAFILKDAPIEEVLDALRDETTASIRVDPEVLGRVLASPAERPDRVTSLTSRELEVLSLLANGRQPKQIARELDMTLNTCRGHVKSIVAKFDAHSALEAVLLAHRHGVLTLPRDAPGPPLH